MKKLRDAETVHKLHQINEADGEDSDDGFGVVAGSGTDEYNMVSNRSSYRPAVSSRDGKGSSALVSDTP